MAFFSDQQLREMRIERMVFHLVGPKASSLIKLEAIDPSTFHDFFMERIRSVNLGTQYKFTDDSITRERLSTILADADAFQVESEALADEFQKLHTGTMAAGAFLLFLLDIEGTKYFAILKSDDETVLAYEVQDGGSDRKKVSLEQLQKTFVQNKTALQKSALIRLNDKGGEVTVLDRRNQTRVALYFEHFLGVVRELDDGDLSSLLVDVTRRVIWENKDTLDPSIVSGINARTYAAAKAGGDIDAENQKSFLETSIGHKLADEDPLAKAYAAALKTARIADTPIKLNVDKVRDAKTIRLLTNKGIELRIPIEFRNLVEEKDGKIIISDGLKVTYDDTR